MPLYDTSPGPAVVNDLLPWHVPLSIGSALGRTGFALWDTGAGVKSYVSTAGAQNDEVNWDVVLAAGTWRLDIQCLQRSSSGIITVNFDAVSKGTIDLYNAGSPNNVFLTLGSIVVPVAKKIRVQFLMATKNASSSGYNYFVYDPPALNRTA